MSESNPPTITDKAAEPPKRIWLQWHGDADPDLEVGSVSEGDVSWCRDKIFKRDIEYIRADLRSTGDAGCEWTFDETSHLVDWETRCGVKVSDIGYDEYEQFKFCPYCGKTIVPRTT